MGRFGGKVRTLNLTGVGIDAFWGGYGHPFHAEIAVLTTGPVIVKLVVA